MSKQFTLAEFCRKRGITPEWLSSKEGYLKIDSRTKCLPDDELIVGGDLEIQHAAFPKFPDRVVVGGSLMVDMCSLKEFPSYIEVKGSVSVRFSSFKRIHEQCIFRNRVAFVNCQLMEICDSYHVYGDLMLLYCSLNTLPKGLVVDGCFSLVGSNIRRIPEDCRCKSLVATKSKLESIPDNWSVEKLAISGCPVTQLPKGLRDLRNLDISYTQIREINEPYPNVHLNADWSQLQKLPDNWTPKYVSVRNCPIDTLPKAMSVRDFLDISGTDITVIPDDCHVGRGIQACGSKLRHIPENFVLSSFLDVSGTGVSVIPANVITKKIYCEPGVKVDAYRFQSSKAMDVHPNGQYIMCDGILAKLLERKGNVWRCMDLSNGQEHYMLTDGAGHYAHGKTIQLAKADLRFKVSPREMDQYQKLDLDASLTFEEAYACYRTITGACQFGTDQFIQSLPEVKDTYTIREIIELTQGQYGHKAFAQFFHAA